MQETALSFLLLLAAEIFMTIVNYLKNKLMEHLNRNQPQNQYGTEFA
jgi:hypothetical protein